MKYFLGLMLLLPLHLLAQYYIQRDGDLYNRPKNFEFGVQYGKIVYKGDVGINKHQTFRHIVDDKSYYKFGLFLNYFVSPKFSLENQLHFGTLRGADSLIKYSTLYEDFIHYRRNLDFTTPYWEWNTNLKFYFNYPDSWFQPYALTGLGFFHMQPKTIYNIFDNGSLVSSTWVNLQTVHTEGEGRLADRPPYKLTQFMFPFGVGAKFYLNHKYFVGLEVIGRKTFTDYIDDVSKSYVHPAVLGNPTSIKLSYRERYYRQYYYFEQRGNGDNKDTYFSGLIRLGMNLNIKTRFTTANGYYRCPKI